MARLNVVVGVTLVALSGVLLARYEDKIHARWQRGKEYDTVCSTKNPNDVCSCIAKGASYCLVTDERSESIEERLRSQELVHELVQKAEWSRSLTIVLVGESGVGKATLVNGIIGEELIVRNESSVQLISKREINGIDVTVIDTAEIMDAEEDEIEEIKKEAAKGVDLVLFCIRMTQVRFRRNDIELIWKVREVFPVEIWNNAIFILTYANQLRLADEPYENHFMEKLSQWKDVLLRSYENHFMEKLSQWRKVLLNAVQEYGKAAQEVAQKIPVIPAGYKDPKLPYCDEWSNCKNWFSELWYVVLERVQCGKKIALLEINRNRFRISTDDINQRRLPYEMVISPISEETEFEITVTIYDVVGVVVAFVLAIAGFYYTLKDSKGSKEEGDEGGQGVLKGSKGEEDEVSEGVLRGNEVSEGVLRGNEVSEGVLRGNEVSEGVLRGDEVGKRKKEQEYKRSPLGQYKNTGKGF